MAAIGVVIRLAAIWSAPQRSYLPDHKDALAWGTYAYRHGPYSLYDMPAPQPIFVAIDREASSVRLDYAIHAYNYPPFSAYVFWLQAALWHGIEAEPVSLPRDAESLARLSERGVNAAHTWLPAWTLKAHFASAAPTIAVDLLLALGVLHVVRTVGAARRSRLAELLAFSGVLLAPPVFLNSAFWNQYEAWLCCPVVWALVMLLRGRPATAGGLFGLALMTKTSALLCVPVVGYLALAYAWAHRRRAVHVLAAGALFLAGFVTSIAACAGPFALRDFAASRPDWPLRWLERSYLEPLTTDTYAYTTLSALNLWWLDYVWQRGATVGAAGYAALDPHAVVLGMTKDSLGRTLVAGAVALAFLLCTARSRLSFESSLVFACLVLMAAFVLPTRVHERYAYFCIPFLIAMAALRPLWLAPCLLMLTVGTFEMVSFRWLTGADVFRPWSPALVTSVVLSGLSIAALALGFCLSVQRWRTDPQAIRRVGGYQEDPYAAGNRRGARTVRD